MRITFTFFLFSLLCITGWAQGVAINTTGLAGDSSAMLDISSAVKGLLIPRMSTPQVSSIVRPAKGLLVYDSTRAALMVNMGGPLSPDWESIASAANGGGGWGTTGNAGTNSAMNFIGTTDTASLRFRVDNIPAGRVDTTDYNTALGFRTLNGTNAAAYNTALGYSALGNNAGGQDNTAVGVDALLVNSTGSANVGVGTLALFQNTTGNDNTATGVGALYTNTTGAYNTGIGAGALYYDSIGQWNTAVGSEAAAHMASGINNTALGGEALFSDTTGSYSTAVGYKAGMNNGNANYNTAIGYMASTTAGAQNSTAIGANASTGKSNTIQLGDINVTTVNTQGNYTVLGGLGLIRSIDAIQRKEVVTPVAVNLTIPAGATAQVPFTFLQSFSGAPDAYVGNVNEGGGGFAEVILSMSGITSTGGVLFINNPRSTPYTPNFTVRVIAIGPQ